MPVRDWGMASELRKIGVNINQTAKNLNSGYGLYSGQVEGVREDLKKWQLPC